MRSVLINFLEHTETAFEIQNNEYLWRTSKQKFFPPVPESPSQLGFTNEKRRGQPLTLGHLKCACQALLKKNKDGKGILRNLF